MNLAGAVDTVHRFVDGDRQVIEGSVVSVVSEVGRDECLSEVVVNFWDTRNTASLLGPYLVARRRQSSGRPVQDV